MKARNADMGEVNPLTDEGLKFMNDVFETGTEVKLLAESYGYFDETKQPKVIFYIEDKKGNKYFAVHEMSLMKEMCEQFLVAQQKLGFILGDKKSDQPLT